MMTVSQSVKYFDSEKSITHMTTVLEVASDAHNHEDQRWRSCVRKVGQDRTMQWSTDTVTSCSTQNYRSECTISPVPHC